MIISSLAILWGNDHAFAAYYYTPGYDIYKINEHKIIKTNVIQNILLN